MSMKPQTLLAGCTLEHIATIYNSVSERQIRRFTDKETAVRRTVIAVEAARHQIALVEGIVVAVSLDAPQALVGDARVIERLVSNPKRIGCKAYYRWAGYASGTVGGYVASCVSLGYDRQVANRDILWDEKHGFIRLLPAGTVIEEMATEDKLPTAPPPPRPRSPKAKFKKQGKIMENARKPVVLSSDRDDTLTAEVERDMAKLGL